MLAESMGCQPELGDKKVGFWCWGVGGLHVVSVQPLADHSQVLL